jgi:tRNA(Ile)-lysidine synthase TilS/MesJ
VTFAKYTPWDEEDCDSQEKMERKETKDEGGRGEKANEHVKSQIMRLQNTFPSSQYITSLSISSNTGSDNL